MFFLLPLAVVNWLSFARVRDLSVSQGAVRVTVVDISVWVTLMPFA